MPAVSELFRSCPQYMMLDDHEIIDNWTRRPHGEGTDITGTSRLRVALMASVKLLSGSHSGYLGAWLQTVVRIREMQAASETQCMRFCSTKA